MKKLLLFLSIGLIISCESTVVEKSAGLANSDGAKYIFGSEEEAGNLPFLCP